MSQNLERLFALEGGAKRRGAKKGSKKASKGKKAMRGGSCMEDIIDQAQTYAQAEILNNKCKPNEKVGNLKGFWCSSLVKGKEKDGKVCEATAPTEAAQAQKALAGATALAKANLAMKSGLKGGAKKSKKASKGSKKAQKGGKRGSKKASKGKKASKKH